MHVHVGYKEHDAINNLLSKYNSPWNCTILYWITILLVYKINSITIIMPWYSTVVDIYKCCMVECVQNHADIDLTQL